MNFAKMDNHSGGSSESTPMAEINMVPLIDVMLVLLVIFIVTAPLLTHAVKMDLPRASSQVNQTPPETVQVGIDIAGNLSWNGEKVNLISFSDRLAGAAAQRPQPELHVRADQYVAYGAVAQVLAAASRAGVAKVGFVSLPQQ
jgi:biopolymer transport protein ExbD